MFLIGCFLDVVVWKELWRNGLDYRYGIGYGIGMFLSVYEGEVREMVRVIKVDKVS